mmetsp:Transcript_10011/g.23848  ORF Transcript_10011/g.23848 Transcript_10011/m.23848 type:complete len:866 (-) Transcript_10011:206-2803(-)
MVDSDDAVAEDNQSMMDYVDGNNAGSQMRISEPISPRHGFANQQHSRTQRTPFQSPMTTRKRTTKPFSQRLRLAEASTPPQPSPSTYNLFSNQLKAMGTDETQGGVTLPPPPLSKEPLAGDSQQSPNDHARISTHHWMAIPERTSHHVDETDHRRSDPSPLSHDNPIHSDFAEDVVVKPPHRQISQIIDRHIRQSNEQKQRNISGASSSDLDKYLKGQYGSGNDEDHQSPIDRRIRQARKRSQRKFGEKATKPGKKKSSEPNPTHDGSSNEDDDDSFEYRESPGAFGVHSVGVDQYGKGILTRQPNRKSLPGLSPPPIVTEEDDSPSIPVVSASPSTEEPLRTASYHGRSYERDEHNYSRILGDTLHISLREDYAIVARARVVVDPSKRGRQRRRASHPEGSIMPTSIEDMLVGDTSNPWHSGSVCSSVDSIGSSTVDDKDSVKGDDKCCHRQNRLLWIVLIALVLMSAIGFGVGVNSSSQSSSALRGAPDNSNSTAPPSHNKDDMRLELFRAWIVDKGISDAESLADPDSAPYRALDWLACHDPLELPVPVVENTDSPNLAMTHDHQTFLERYVASVLYFATNERLDFRVQEESVCTWHTNDNKGIYCRGENDIGVTHISLPQAFLSGYFPLELCSLPNLVHIDFSHNSLADLPDNIGKCSQLEYLLLGDNPWVLGTENKGFPSTFFELTNLKDLQLYRSFLQASIPSTIGRLTRLEVLQMKSNKIYGTIPSQLWDLSTLQVLNLGYNDIEGEISSSISNTNLTHLLLGTNILEGTLPSQIGELTNLVQLDLSSNYLSGAVPNELASLSNLVALDLSFNFDLSGSLDGLCNSTMILPQNDTDTTIETPSFFASEPLVCSCCTKI